jgi:hypothetical protein
MIRWYRYARWEDVASWETKGWKIEAELGVPHGLWSVLMIWTGEGDPT